MICMEILEDTEEPLLLGLGLLRNRRQDRARHARDLMEENTCEGQKYRGIGEDAAKIQEGGMDPVVGDRQGECFLNSPRHSIAQASVTVTQNAGGIEGQKFLTGQGWF